MSEISEHCVHIVLLPTSREKLATVALAPLPNAQHMAHLKFTELTVVGPFRLWHPCRIFLRFSACERVSATRDSIQWPRTVWPFKTVLSTNLTMATEYQLLFAALRHKQCHRHRTRSVYTVLAISTPTSILSEVQYQ